MNKLVRIAASLIVAHLAGSALAQSTPLDTGNNPAKDSVLRLQFSPFTYHFTYDSAHADVVMIGLERERPNGKLDGVTLFTNSFGQPTVYVYPWGGVYKELFEVKNLSFKWTAGLMYGYKDPYEKKVPLNYRGLSPVIIPALVYEFKPGWSGQLNFLGNAAMMFQLNMNLK